MANYEGEIQARDVTLGVLKGEYVKNLMNNVKKEDEESNPEGTYKQDPFFALQRDSLVARSNRSKANPDLDQVFFMKQQMSLTKHKQALKRSLSCLKESERQREICLQELKELKESQKKAEEEASKSAEPDETSPKTVEDLTAEVDNLQLQLKEERKNKQQIVLLLCNDRKQIATRYLQEQRRTERLARALKEEKARTQTLAIELEEESKRSLALETDLDHAVRQVEQLREENKKMMVEEKRKSLDVEEALRRCKSEAEHLRKQLAEAHRVAMSQASVVSTLPNPNQTNYGTVVRNPSPDSYSLQSQQSSNSDSLTGKVKINEFDKSNNKPIF